MTEAQNCEIAILLDIPPSQLTTIQHRRITELEAMWEAKQEEYYMERQASRGFSEAFGPDDDYCLNLY